MASLQPTGIKSPLQLFGFYLAWTETAMGGSLFATKTVTWAQNIFMVVMAFGLATFVGVTAFLLIRIVMKHPGLLFNPSDFDPAVQHLLLSGPNVPSVQVTPPPANPAPAATPGAI
jgi:hypothetical protein